MTTRPDIAYKANIFRSFRENPGNKLWNAAKTILRYLKATKSKQFISRKCDKLDLKGIPDFDCAGNFDSRKITSDYCFKIDNCSRAINWARMLQMCVSTSTVEAELSAALEVSKDVVHLSNLLKEMNIDFEQSLQVFVDIEACIALSKSSMNYGKTKHVALKVRFFQNLFGKRLWELNYLTTDCMRPDNITKALRRTQILLFCDVRLGSNI